MATITQVEKNGLFELTDAARAELVSSKYYNEDLAPSSVSQRNWTTYSISMLWVGMCICITLIYHYPVVFTTMKTLMEWHAGLEL